tara:strand:+ start:183 stop:386 length:204 start_codon:yes stop_codon:yes gene_type:complete
MKYSINFNSFSQEELQAWARAQSQAHPQNKQFIEHDLSKAKSAFSNSSGDLPDKLQNNIEIDSGENN